MVGICLELRQSARARHGSRKLLKKILGRLPVTPFGKRELLSDAAILEQAGQSADLALEDVSAALDIVSEHLDLDRGKIRLSDQLSALSGQSFVTPKLDNLSDALYQSVEHPLAQTVEEIETVCDVAQLYAALRLISD